MSLTHGYHLLATSRFSPADYSNWPPDTEGVQLHDDLRGYFWDALSWVECIYPHAGMKRVFGPDPYGPSVVTTQGASTLAQVFDGFANVFSCGPDTIRLNCGPSWEVGDNPADQTSDNMQWYFAEFSREETVGRLRQIANAARTVLAAPSDWFIAIRGI
jgi:hypothetical protein